MIEVKAKLTRIPVYFANELINCVVTFSNKQESKEEVEKLAWCVVQIHCLVFADENKITIPIKNTKTLKEEQLATNTNRETSFHPCKGERGQVLFSTEPKFLFCDLTLNINESQNFYFTDFLPANCPPTYTGNAVKYFYKLTLGIQRVNSSIQLLRMPLKILNVPKINLDNDKLNLNDSQNSTLNKPETNSENDDCFENNKNCQQVNKNEFINSLLHKLDCLSSKRTLNSYIITNPLGKVGKFSTYKTIFKLGEDIIGFFNFSDSDIPCVQFTVTLQSEELISEEYQSKLKNQNSFFFTYSQCQDVCIHSQNSQIILPIPLNITPTFETNIMKLNWKLHFEFVTTRPEDLNCKKYEDNFGYQKLSPKCINVQTMFWDLPITILPTHPIQIGRGLQLPDTSIILI